LDNEIWAFGESADGQTAYGNGIGKSLVDTIRKLVIIAVGGKIGNPPLSCLCPQLTEQGTKGKTHPPELKHHGMAGPAVMELPKEWARG
jgi:hypothetical protein